MISNRVIILKVITVIGVVLLLLSAFLLWASYSKPLYTVEENILGYTTRSSFVYMAELHPNILYPEKTITSEDGKIFQKLVKSMNVTYSFSSDMPRNSSYRGEYVISALLVEGRYESPLWTYELPFSDSGIFSMEDGGVRTTFPVNLSEINQVFSKIEGETGVKEPTRSIAFIAKIKLEGDVDGNPITEAIIHKSSLKLGKILEVNNPKEEKQWIVKKNRQYVENLVNLMGIQIGVGSLRKVGLGGLAVSLVMLAFSGFNLMVRKTTVENTLDNINTKYRSWIVKSSGQKEKGTEILVNSFEDLIKVAEDIGKPIIHINGSTDYKVIDGNVVYMFRAGYSKNKSA